ncbi:MAG: lysophospholipid acyltransferase family protein [Rhodospirillales bacterium]|jgi:1-acyl-sn-glycerol-3-phosphate acyltransferase
MMPFLRSIAFNVVFYGWTALFCVLLSWMLLLPKRWMLPAVRWYLRSVTVIERVFADLRWELRGAENLPAGPCIVAQKHQSAWETMKLHALFDDPAIVYKRELGFIPLWGWFLRKVRMIPIDRGGKGRAIQSLLAGARAVVAEGRPIVIYPQGTRTAPGTWIPYRAGISVLYETLNLPVVPIALNSGMYWARRSFRKRAGTIVVEVLPPIPPGLDRETFVRTLVDRLETATDRLVAEAGGPPTPRPASFEVPRKTAPRTASSPSSVDNGVE